MDPIIVMKTQVIENFLELMKFTNLGISKDYSSIIDKISFIEYAEDMKNADFIYQYLINK